MMIRNVPRKYTSQDMVDELGRFATRGDYNFVYVPWDKSGHTNMGLAFVNFTESATGFAVLERMMDQPWTHAPNGRVIKGQPADVQGLRANLRRLVENAAKRGCFVAEHGPLIFAQGAPIELELALAKYCPDTVPPPFMVVPKAKGFSAEVIHNENFFEDVDVDDCEDESPKFMDHGTLFHKSGVPFFPPPGLEPPMATKAHFHGNSTPTSYGSEHSYDELTAPPPFGGSPGGWSSVKSSCSSVGSLGSIPTMTESSLPPVGLMTMPTCDRFCALSDSQPMDKFRYSF